MEIWLVALWSSPGPGLLGLPGLIGLAGPPGLPATVTLLELGGVGVIGLAMDWYDPPMGFLSPFSAEEMEMSLLIKPVLPKTAKLGIHF